MPEVIITHLGAQMTANATFESIERLIVLYFSNSDQRNDIILYDLNHLPVISRRFR